MDTKICNEKKQGEIVTKNRIIRASEIGQFSWCPYAYHLLKKGISPQQTLQDLQKAKILPVSMVKHLREKGIQPTATIDKIIGQGLIPKHLEQRIIKQNILLQGGILHEKRGMTTKQNAMVQEHRGGYTLALIIILIIIGFLVMILLQGGGMP